ncbi:EH signature domain-containing protein [Asticcacaulis sp. AC402]|uniref:EH signature domain-containing protein n=1 Tax=Asticcacaulis sp. AC402 TaxID=1282361 RepID=UPI0003C4048C|nr:EH signature domain-containing protein [Asticcacaulis sp. AC402]ESQ74516.1 hypothetical protein ABAC402_13590 [Asticcacaulis sp. AC402]
MSLRDAVTSPKEFSGPIRVRDVEPIQMRKAIKALPDFGSGTPKGLDVAELQARFVDRVSNNTLASVSPAEMRQCPYGFFDEPRPFIDDPTVTAALLSELATRAQKSATRILIYQYLEHYNPSKPGCVAVANWLDQQVMQWNWAWRDRSETYALFNAEEAPAKLAIHILASQAPVREVFEDLGLSDTILTGSLGEAAFAAACIIVSASRSAKAQGQQRRLMEWARRGDRFGYEKAFPAYVSALLMPWQSSEPDAAHKAALLAELESFAGDPRVKPARWARVKSQAAQAYDVLMRWLTRASVYQFFDIIDQVLSADEMRMWAYRRPFWTSYLEPGYISEAWVAFGANGASQARHVARTTGGDAALGFATLTGKSQSHAALIMKIGDLTVAEWSHNGKYNIWPSASQNAPRLYKTRYDAYELSGAPFDGSHYGSDSFSWQRKIARKIEVETGFSTQKTSWMPRRFGR